MKVCIRDDDLCYWSNFQDFKKLYDELSVPVSISLIPNAVSNHGLVSIYNDNYPIGKPKLVTCNKELCDGLREGIKNKNYEILLHGYTHEYKVISNEQIIPELLWKDKSRIKKEMAEGKKLLEKEFNIHINVFVAPSQAINQDGIDAMSGLGMNFSGLAHGRGDRKKSFKLFVTMVRRYTSRILYGLGIMGVANFKNHKEQGIIPIMDLKKMVKYYKICKKHDWNYVIVTHYWQLLKDEGLKMKLKSFVEYVKNDGRSFSFVSECF